MSQFFSKARQRLSGTDPVYLCLFPALGLVVLLIGASGYSFYFLEHYAMIPAMLFWGVLLTRKHSTDTLRHLALGIGFSAWFVISQILQYAAGLSVRSPGVFFLVYLMAFPFASAARDTGKQTGLKMAGFAYICGALVLAFLTGLLSLDLLPGFLKPHVYWDGARLRAMWHPNVCGCVCMIAMAFCLYFFSESRRKLHKGLWAAVAAGMFLLITLTNSRTAILLSCCLLAGYLFFRIWNGSWKRFFLGAAAAAAVLVLVFLLSRGIFSLHNDYLTRQIIENQNSETFTGSLVIDEASGEVTLQAEAAQESLLKDAATLNSRTNIWKAAVKAAGSSKAVLLRGTDNSTVLVGQFYSIPIYSHNSYLEALLTMGIPGMLFALVFTLLALWRIGWVLLSPNTSMALKTIALLMIALMGAGMLEAYLFQGNMNFLYTEFAFSLCLGYLSRQKEAR